MDRWKGELWVVYVGSVGGVGLGGIIILIIFCWLELDGMVIINYEGVGKCRLVVGLWKKREIKILESKLVVLVIIYVFFFVFVIVEVFNVI